MSTGERAATVEPVTPVLPARDARGHKGVFGTVAAVGGCVGDEAGTPRMVGGASLAALAALRAGAGLAQVVAPGAVLDAALTIAPECTGVALPTLAGGEIAGAGAAAALDRVIMGLRATGEASGGGGGAIAIGPGLGPANDGTRAAVMRVISQERVAAVVDADGLTALATMPEANRDMRAAAVLTPHPGEWRTLAGAFVLEGDAAGDAEERELAAKSLARRFGCVVVLKGDDTVVTDGVRSWRLSEASVAGGVLVANPLLATGGSGDVLTGMVAGVIAQHVKPALLAGEHSMPSEQLGGISLFDAARAAVTAHAIAGRAARERDGRTGGLLARELADLAPVGIEALRMTSGTARAAGGR